VRVVYVSTLEGGAPVTHLRLLAPRVAAEGVDVEVICASEPVAESFRALDVSAQAAPVGHKLDLRGGAALWRRLGEADLVHTQDRRAGLFGRIGGRLHRSRVVHTLHGMPEEIAARVGRPEAPAPPGVSRARLAWLEHGYLPLEAGLTRLGHVVAPSQAMVDFMLGHGFPASRLHVIPLGIHAGPAAQPREDGGLVAGVASNLEYWKGVDVLIEAAAAMRAPVRLEIFGTGSLAGELERQARDAEVDARFHGFVPFARSRLRELDVLVQPSRADNFPLAVLEAMAAGIAVVATRVGGVPELVVDGETGLIVEPEDPAALAEALDSLAAEPVRRRELGRRGRARVLDEFTPERMAQRTVALYRDLCASST
jgi:glycosyltransferase involved in cell wall biosynthesis